MGTTVSGNSSVPAGGTFDIRPPAGEYWVIHNVSGSGSFRLQTTDGTDVAPLDSEASPTLWVSNMDVYISGSLWLQAVDTSGSTNVMHYDGELAEPSALQAFFI